MMPKHFSTSSKRTNVRRFVGLPPCLDSSPLSFTVIGSLGFGRTSVENQIWKSNAPDHRPDCHKKRIVIHSAPIKAHHESVLSCCLLLSPVYQVSQVLLPAGTVQPHPVMDPKIRTSS
jgi:hypothetical protein